MMLLIIIARVHISFLIIFNFFLFFFDVCRIYVCMTIFLLSEVNNWVTKINIFYLYQKKPNYIKMLLKMKRDPL